MKWKIYFLLFGSVLSLGIFTTFTKTAHAIESYKISPEDDRTIRRGFYSSSNIKDEKHIDLHYYFYAQNNYSENLRVIAYICDYKADYYNDNSLTSVPDCGLSMVQEAGKFKIKINAGYFASLEYSRRTQKIITSYYNYNSVYNNQNYDIASFTDQDFENGLTLLGGSTLKANNWNRNEGGFLVDPVGGNSNSSNNSSNNSGGFDIFGGIKAFFQPMIDSITRTQKVVLGISDTIINGIKNLFSSLIESVKNIWDFLYNLPSKIPEMIKFIFVPSQEELNNELSNIRSMFSFEQITRVLNTTYLPLNSAGFSYGSYCSDAYWDATTPHLNNLLNSGGQKYTNGFRLTTSICKVPKIYITLARNLLMFAFFWWAVYRILQIIPVVMGSAYIWDRWFKKEG
jgi:hypothetical protein